MTVGFQRDPALAGFLRAHGWDEAASRTRLGGGDRHRVERLERPGKLAVLKVHERIDVSGRDAFRHEVSLHRFISEFLPGEVAAIAASDEECRAILFELIEGERPQANRIGELEVEQMAGFLARLNQPVVRRAAEQRRMPRATDAGRSMGDHLQCVRDRLGSLDALPAESPVAKEMRDFLESALVPAAAVLAAKLPGTEPSQCLSPSDFGFHNVLVRPSGGFCFLDFEHAGWDDPAKLVADFILQPEFPLSAELGDCLLSCLEASGVFGHGLPKRVRELLPVQKVKWATIILNVFHRPQVGDDVLCARLAKAKSYWQCVIVSELLASA